MRILAATALALATLSLPAGAQIRVVESVPPELAAELAARQAAQAGMLQQVNAQNAVGNRTPEQERTQLLQQLVIDRSASGILQARLEAARPPDEGDPPADPDAPPPPEAVGPPGPAEQQQLEDQNKRQQYRAGIDAFRRQVVLGEWAQVRAYLEALPENDARVAFSRVLSQLGSPVQVSPRAELAVMGAKPHQQQQYLRPAEVLALSDASPAPPDHNTLKQLAGLLADDAPPPDEFFAVLRSGTRYFGRQDLETQRRTAAFLLDAKLLDRSREFLPATDAARDANDLAALNLIARYHAEAHQAGEGNEHLPAAWTLCLEVLGNREAPLDQRGEALYRALALVPELDDEAGTAWLQNTFTHPAGEGFEILAAVGTLASQSREMTSADFRLENLKLQSAAAAALLGTEGADLAAWAEVLTLYALNWIHEAQFSYQRDQNTSMRPMMQIDQFGNPYYVHQSVNYDGRGNAPVPAGDLLACQPADSWLALVDEPVRLDCLAVTARLYLKLKEETEAFPVLQQLARARPKQAESLVREMITVWAANHNPNQATRYRSSYYYFYGANPRAESIPLTRSKQERNLRELAVLVREIRALELDASFEEEFADAFIQAHSQAEVWRLEALEQVFGIVDQLDTKTIAALLRRMRINLASLWPDPRLQEEYKTKRRDKELAQHILKGYTAAKTVARRVLDRDPESWRLQAQLAALDYEQSNYESSLAPQADHSTTKRASLDDLAAAARAYAATLPLEDKDDESADVFETWFFAALGSPDLGALKAHHQPVPADFPKIRAALETLPGDCAARHLELFATTINNRLANVSPDLKYRYLAAALEITGAHERIRSAADVFQYYKDLITEIELVATLDGPDTVGSDRPFGLFLNLRHTQEIERESGGFQRYLQNQNNAAYAYNYGRPTEDYRDKFEKAARAVLDEHFEILSLTFHEPKVQSRSDPVLGWRVTPYAYFLLEARGPQVDTIPPLTIDLDFLDTSGYVVLPVSSSALPIDASRAQPRPLRNLKVALTLDERSAGDQDRLFLDVKATAHGLVPPLDRLLELPPAGFTVADTEDRRLLVERLDAETDDGAPLSTHEWRLALVPESEPAPAEFTFPPVLPETAAEDGLTLQRYDDVDLVAVPATVALGARVGRAFNPWLLLAALPLLALLAGGLWLLLRKSGPPPARDHGPAIPSTLTPVTLLAFLDRVRNYDGLSSEQRAELDSEIAALQDRFFGPAKRENASADLLQIARRWKAPA